MTEACTLIILGATGNLAQLNAPAAFTDVIWFRRDVDNAGTANETNHGVNNVLLVKSAAATNDNFEVGTEGDQIEIYVDSNSGGGDTGAGAGKPGEALVKGRKGKGKGCP